MTLKALTVTVQHGLLGHWRDYLALCKPKVVAVMLFTAWVGMLLAAPGSVPWQALVFGTLGIGLMAGSAAALNHVLDRHADALMDRTRGRPLPSGHLGMEHGLVFAGVIGLSGFLILVLLVNGVTATLTLFSLVGYAVVYTVFLKRATPQNIVIGGAAGAMPPLLGWTAVTGQVEPLALVLFLIVFTWTPPHFWALAIYRKDDYARVGIPMLPVTHGEDFTRLQILLYTVLLLAVTLLPAGMGISGWLYLLAALVLGGGFLYHAVMLLVTRSHQRAIRTFLYSIFYLLALFAALLADRYLGFWFAVLSQ
ncbi:Heme O synthase, protoheme IX farnesyltransferase COX10-CtaB [Thioalkalivibrio nitratireducens DSM 14787]|uniref:Protoheme IX farnesyltransferase n=1 Tax=Thioalkalivibrio nitratireducens (strain DSM 14787 / UNIQEM 213 / ALEN2) TaxID=1255043 RepID=L0E0B8_THIND|nr:heme o synthase [Thioalkalivibrio nitratireducens]AGA34655.1 Heme O synthase, protoheme IX farnesyltransferase COX10-CtaB [Thioalkalivibrio nitratireducens DSM 14787]